MSLYEYSGVQVAATVQLHPCQSIYDQCTYECILRVATVHQLKVHVFSIARHLDFDGSL